MIAELTWVVTAASTFRGAGKETPRPGDYYLAHPRARNPDIQRAGVFDQVPCYIRGPLVVLKKRRKAARDNRAGNCSAATGWRHDEGC